MHTLVWLSPPNSSSSCYVTRYLKDTLITTKEANVCKWLLKACPKCHGDMNRVNSHTAKCLQCGYEGEYEWQQQNSKKLVESEPQTPTK